MERPKTSQIVIDEFAKIIDSQDEKGFEKYKVSIDDAVDEQYDWKLMALEEAADLNKYLVRRILELQKQLEQYDTCMKDLARSEQSNQWLLKQLFEAKEMIKELKAKTRYEKYMQLEKENLVLAQENQTLKEQLDNLKG